VPHHVPSGFGRTNSPRAQHPLRPAFCAPKNTEMKFMLKSGLALSDAGGPDSQLVGGRTEALTSSGTEPPITLDECRRQARHCIEEARKVLADPGICSAWL